MPISGSAVGSALNPADNANNSVNSPSGYPAQERWPGSVDPSQYTDAGPEYAIEQAPAGRWTASGLGSDTPGVSSGGGYQDTSWMTGHDAPVVPFDSNAGEPFAPSGPVNQEIHGVDTGAVYQARHTIPAAIGTLVRRVFTGQTYNQEYRFDPVNGMLVPSANGRSNMDQYQEQSPDGGGGYVPREPGYAERPILNNLAYQATAINPTGTVQGVSGDLPNRAPIQSYQAQTYEAPPDPIVHPAPAPVAVASMGGRWVSG